MAGANLVRKLIGEVAGTAPQLTRRRPTLNIGLDVPGGGRLAEEEVLGVLNRIGAKPVRVVKHQSDTEPTLVIELDRALAPEQAHEVSRMLQQEAIAQVDETGAGDLFGPMADKWKPFNGDYFIEGDGRRLTQAIMEAGDPNNVPGGATPDPVMEKLDEIAAGLKPQEPAYNKGGLVKDGAKALMRLYHGRSYREPIKQLDPTISPDQLGIHLGDPETAGKFATIRDNVKPTDAGARVIPLDVDLQNPLRLKDDSGKWHPHKIYKQLADQGLIKYDPWEEIRLERAALGMVQDADGSWVDAGDGVAELDAMLEIQDMIRDLGYDGVVYTNRYELPEEALARANEWPASQRNKLKTMSDDDFRKEFPEAVDSYIAFRREQLKSPFGDGPGVGFSEGGRVKLEGGGRAGVAYKIGKGLVDLLDFSGVTGRPKTVKIPERGEFAAAPISELDEAAEAYMKKHGIPGTHRIDGYPEFDEDFARRIADEYDRAQHLPNDPKVRRAYDALLEETMEQYRALEGSGLDVRFLKEGMSDPYAKSPAMGYGDIVDNGRLWVFPTEQGYGSLGDIADNPLLKKVGRVGDKENAVANDAFRVVHDAYGHFAPGNPFFRHQGEDRAWQHHGRMFTDEALPAMTAETRGQNSWLNFGPYGEQNRKALGADTVFADQKATIMPPWVYEKDLGRTPKFADGGPVWAEGDADIKAYEALRDYVATQPEDIRSMTHVGDKPTRGRKIDMPLLGGEFDLGEAPYDVAGNQEAVLQNLYDFKTVPAYFTPAAPLAAGWDLAEGIATGDPLQMALAVAGSIPGKVYKKAYEAVKPYAKPAAASGALAYALDGDDAEAGMYGTLAKWAKSSEGQDALADATKMIGQGADTNEVRQYTGWFQDLDGHWKFELPSAGGSADLKRPTKGWLRDIYDDPHLFDQYPKTKDTRFRRMNDEGAKFEPDMDTIVVGDLSHPYFNTPGVGGLKGVLDHEIYHWKAGDQGWAQGTDEFTAGHKIVQDMQRFLNSKGDPDKRLAGQVLQSLDADKMKGLAFSRYQAEMGEALARREAMRREFGNSNILHGKPPTADLDLPAAALFDPREYATPDTYRALKGWHDQRIKGKK
jgi:hypothetical protein